MVRENKSNNHVSQQHSQRSPTVGDDTVQTSQENCRRKHNAQLVIADKKLLSTRDECQHRPHTQSIGCCWRQPNTRNARISYDFLLFLALYHYLEVEWMKYVFANVNRLLKDSFKDCSKRKQSRNKRVSKQLWQHSSTVDQNAKDTVQTLQEKCKGKHNAPLVIADKKHLKHRMNAN